MKRAIYRLNLEISDPAIPEFGPRVPKRAQKCRVEKNWSMNRRKAGGEFLVSRSNPLFTREIYRLEYNLSLLCRIEFCWSAEVDDRS